MASTRLSSLDKALIGKMNDASFKHVLAQGWAGWVSTQFVLRGAMGDSVSGVDWSKLTTGELLQTIQDIVVELSIRDQNWEQVEPQASTSTGSTSAQPVAAEPKPKLLEPWTCGYRCKWCERPCTRDQGHTRHSCWYCRHER